MLNILLISKEKQMRKMMIMAAVLGIGWAAQGCKKTSTPEILKEQSRRIGLEHVKCEDGVLIFDTEADLYQAMDELAALTKEERMAWEKRMNFESLNTILDKVNDAEVEHIDKLIGDYDPNLSVEEFGALGIVYSPTQIKTHYLQKRVLEEIPFSDNSTGLELTVKNIAYHNVLGEKRTVIAGQLIIVCDKSNTALYSRENNELISEYDFNNKSQYNFTWGIGLWSTDRHGWRFDYADPNNDKKRIRSFVLFTSGFNANVLFTTYYWHCRAETRVLNQWNTRNNYTPFRGFTGNWSFKYSYLPINSFSSVVCYEPGGPTVLGAGATASPVNWNALTACCPSGTNSAQMNLRPHGNYVSSSSFEWFRNVEVFTKSYSVNVHGVNRAMTE
jgi:hypothetical protein